MLGGTYIFFTIEYKSQSDRLSYEQKIPDTTPSIPTADIPQEEISIESVSEISSSFPVPEVKEQRHATAGKQIIDEHPEAIMAAPAEEMSVEEFEKKSADMRQIPQTVENTSAVAGEKKAESILQAQKQQGHIYIAGNGHIFGSLMDEQGEPIIGANVSVKGAKQETITDMDEINSVGWVN